MNANFIWSDESASGRNIFSLFRRQFELNGVPSDAQIHLFADSLYRLWINGIVAGYGPARFQPSHPIYDTYDIGAHLHSGKNEIVVEVNHLGASCFQAVTSRVPGFVAWGAISDVGGSQHDLATPGHWQARVSTAWDQESEPFSFAQGPAEICDRRQLRDDASAWKNPVLVSKGPWGELQPRDFRQPSLRLRPFSKIFSAYRLEKSAIRVGARGPLDHGKGKRAPFITHVWSPRKQEADLGLFWGPVFLNGEKISTVKCSWRSHRENGRVVLREGWNFVYALPELLTPHWTWLMEIPGEIGLRVAAEPGDKTENLFYVGPVMIQEAEPTTAPAIFSEVVDFSQDWKLAGERKTWSPAREIGWDMAGENMIVGKENNTVHIEGGDASVIFDFEGEYLGHVVFEVDSSPGTMIDVAYDERIHPLVPRLDYYASNVLAHTAERFITAGGHERIEGFHERGGRYVQITLRNASGPISLSAVAIHETAANYPVTGSFSCSDELFNWTWRTGIQTVQACLTDIWVDCPWRERGAYLGDTVVEEESTRCFSPDWRMGPRALRLWSHAQHPSGHLPGLVPASLEDEQGLENRSMNDFTLHYIVLLRNYWAATGDVALVRELWITVERILNSTSGNRLPDGLWKDCSGFIDAGIHPDAKKGVSSIFNALWIKSYEAGIELAQAIGSPEAKKWRREALRMREAFHQALWLPGEGRYAAAVGDDKTPGYHGTIIAIGLGIPQGEDRKRAVDSLRHTLLKERNLDGRGLEIFFLYFTLEALASAGEHALAEETIRAYYSIMRQNGAWTIWEHMAMGIQNQGSLCHAWSTGAMTYFHRHILGCAPAIPGDPDRLRIAPMGQTLLNAKGDIPHPRGTVHIDWRRVGQEIHLIVDVPEGVSCGFDLELGWKGLRHEVTLNGKRIEAIKPETGLSSITRARA